MKRCTYFRASLFLFKTADASATNFILILSILEESSAKSRDELFNMHKWMISNDNLRREKQVDLGVRWI